MGGFAAFGRSEIAGSCISGVRMRAHLRYLCYVLRHKWYVLVAGRRVGAPLWRLLIHDWSKFTPAEWGAYVEWFYGGPFGKSWHGHEHVGGEVALAKAAFDRAWNHHQKVNKHHWQYWCLLEDSPSGYPSYRLTSPDGGMRYFCLTEYLRPYPEPGPHPIQADLLGLEDDGRDETQQRYLMVKRCCDAANARRPVALRMPEKYAREMVADWMGAGRAITGRWEVREWYAKNREKIVLHPETRGYVEVLLGRAA